MQHLHTERAARGEIESVAGNLSFIVKGLKESGSGQPLERTTFHWNAATSFQLFCVRRIIRHEFSKPPCKHAGFFNKYSGQQNVIKN